MNNKNDYSAQKSSLFKTSFIGYASIISVGLLLTFLVNQKSDADYEVAVEHYKKVSEAEALQATKNISYSIKQLYQGIRTISLLPSVKNIDRYGKNLDANAHAAIEQIYDNMVSNVAVSEIYIVPADLEPEQIDKVTGGLQEPILMYDGKATDQSKPETEKPPVTSVEQAKNVAEVEIYEYQLLKEQMTYLKQNYPSNKNIGVLDLPLISGSQVLTCDNDEFEKTHSDADRMGIVMSVPFYANNGELKGTISAIIRNNVLQKMIPSSDYALVNQDYNYTLLAKDDGQQQKSLEFIKQVKPDSSLIFSATLPVEENDPRSKWSLWVGYPDEKFTESSDAKAIHSFRITGSIFTGILTILSLIIWSVMRRLAKNQKMQEKISEQKKREALQEMAENFEFSVKGMVSQVASSAAQMQVGAENLMSIAKDTKQLSTSVANSSQESADTSSQVAAAADELTASIKEISAQTHKSSQIAEQASQTAQDAQETIKTLAEKSNKVAEIIGVITGIAGKINLLALNATIESARAGEAGKGFAVVASEVKILAGQVAKAAEEITAQISEMKEATDVSVDSVLKIMSIISQVSESTTTVASAVEEQSAVTDEIARNTVLTSTGTKGISNSIKSVQEGADKTENTATELLASAKNLSTNSNALTKKVEEFLNMLQKS